MENNIEQGDIIAQKTDMPVSLTKVTWDSVWNDPTFTLMSELMYIEDFLPPIFNNFNFTQRWKETDALAALNDRLIIADGSPQPLLLTCQVPAAGDETVFFSHHNITVMRPPEEATAITIALGVRSNYILNGAQPARNAGPLSLASVPNMIAYWNADIRSRKLASSPIQRMVTPNRLTWEAGNYIRPAIKMVDLDTVIAVDVPWQSAQLYLINYALGQSLQVDWAEIQAYMVPQIYRGDARFVDVSNNIANGNWNVPPHGGAIPLVPTNAAITYMYNMFGAQDWAFGHFFAQQGLVPGDLGNAVLANSIIAVPKYDFWSHLITSFTLRPNTGYHAPNFTVCMIEAALYKTLARQYIAQAYGAAPMFPRYGQFVIDNASLNFINYNARMAIDRIAWLPWEYVQLINPNLVLKGSEEFHQWNGYLTHQVTNSVGLYRSYVTTAGQKRFCHYASGVWTNDVAVASAQNTYRPLAAVEVSSAAQKFIVTYEWTAVQFIDKVVNTPFSGAGSQIKRHAVPPTFL